MIMLFPLTIEKDRKKLQVTSDVVGFSSTPTKLKGSFQSLPWQFLHIVNKQRRPFSRSQSVTEPVWGLTYGPTPPAFPQHTPTMATKQATVEHAAYLPIFRQASGG